MMRLVLSLMTLASVLLTSGTVNASHDGIQGTGVSGAYASKSEDTHGLFDPSEIHLVPSTSEAMYPPSPGGWPSPVTTLTIGSNPYGVAVNPVTGRVYVTRLEHEGTVFVFDGESNRILARIPSVYPGLVAVNSRTNRVYVANPETDSISVIDGDSNSVIATIAVGDWPHGVAVNAVNNRIYVPNGDDNDVSVIDGTSNEVITRVPVGDLPGGIALNPETGRIYVANYHSANVSVIDGNNNDVVATIEVGRDPADVAVNQKTNLIYVTNQYPDDSSVSVIDGDKNGVIRTIPVGDDPQGLALDVNTNLIFVANVGSDDLSVIAGGSNTVVSTAKVGLWPWQVAVDPKTKHIFVTNGGSGMVSVLQILPPVLFVHGCGGALGTWTDPGWITDATGIGDFTAGGASGKLYRAVIPGQPAIPAYALDYHDSQGSIFDLAALVPQAIGKIKEETGAEKVMLATHSMGGVIAQAYVGGLASGRPYDNDVEAAFMVAPPSRGSFLVNWLTGKAGNALACPQASELGPKSDSIARLRAADLPELDYSVVSGTRFWIPFVGLNDGVIADGDVGLSSAGYDKRQVPGIHTDVQLLPNTVAALCETVLSQPCVSELRMDEVKGLFRQRYKEDMFE